MDYTEYTAVKNRFTTSPNLCDLFKLLSIETWKRIEYAYLKPRIKVFETTVTQNLIFTINAFNDQYGLNIDVLEALDEKTNGNDFELIIRFPNDGIEYYAPIQAKKVYRNGKYLSMDHGVQIESLINYASANNAKPLYLLYNFAASPLRSGITLTVPSELTGCTLISAEHLFTNHYNNRTKRDGSLAWHIPHFYDLNPRYAFPWHEIVCPSTAADFYKTLQKRGLASQLQIENSSELIQLNGDLKQGFYPSNTFKKDDGWASIKDLYVPKQDFENEYENKERMYQTQDLEQREKFIQKKESSKERVLPKFSPKSRLILNK
jgi:hypothetical protein